MGGSTQSRQQSAAWRFVNCAAIRIHSVVYRLATSVANIGWLRSACPRMARSAIQEKIQVALGIFGSATCA
jgi:hypothetical protein